MNEDTPDAADVDSGDEATGEDVLDKYDQSVIAADDTGMLAGERTITVAEIEEGLAGGLGEETGDV
jgi:hypothetical protein